MITKKFCPRCGSDDVDMIAGGIIGAWMCRKCGYSGSIFPEREIVGGEQSMDKNKKALFKKINKFLKK